MKICQVCGASFVSKGNLKQHMEAIHEKTIRNRFVEFSSKSGHEQEHLA